MLFPYKKRDIIVFLFALAFIFPACSLWDSMTAYFNTYYNAQQLFSEAENELWSQKEFLQTGRDYYLGKMEGVNKTKFTSVIEKCSKLLQYHPESSLVDDALFMIGMSYYYQSDFQQALRKYRELLDGYPTSSLAPRSRLMMAYSLYRLGSTDSALSVASASLEWARTEGRDAILGQSAMLLGQIEDDRQNLEGARGYYMMAGEDEENADLRVTAYLKAGVMAEEDTSYAAADSAYHLAEKSSRSYLGEYRSRIGMARMKARLHDFSGAMADLKDLRSNANYREFWGEIEFEIGNTLRLEGKIDEAITQYHYVDTAYARSEYAAESNFELGKLYEYSLANYDSAKSAYTRGRVYSAPNSIGPLVAHRADLTTRYVAYRNDLLRMDSIRASWVIRRDSLIARDDSLRRAIASTPPSPPTPDTAKAAPPANSAASDTSAKVPEDSVKGSAPPPAPPGRESQPPDTVSSKSPAAPQAVVPLVLPNIDSLDQHIADIQSELGTLFYTSLDQPDSARYWLRRFVSGYPTNPGVPRALYTLAQIAGADSTHRGREADSLYRLIIEKYPTSAFANESRRVLGMPQENLQQAGAEAAYARAEQAVLDTDYARAIAGFREVIEKYPQSPYASRAQYAIGWVFENPYFHPDSALASYQLLVSRYPTSPYVPLVQGKLLAAQVEKTAPKSDSLRVEKPVARPRERAPQPPGAGPRTGRAARQHPHDARPRVRE